MTRKIARPAMLSGLLVACGLCLSGCWPWPHPVTFELRVTPAAVVDLAQNASAVFLVSIDGIDATPALPATLAVTASAGTATASSATIERSEVVEVWLSGAGVPIGTVVRLTVEARRNSETHIVAVEATITEPVGAPDDRLETGLAVRDSFLPWLIAEHPELGITADAVWTPNPLRAHILEVSFYMFTSAEWELVVW
jgi:hypothetical protein